MQSIVGLSQSFKVSVLDSSDWQLSHWLIHFPEAWLIGFRESDLTHFDSGKNRSMRCAVCPRQICLTTDAMDTGGKPLPVCLSNQKWPDSGIHKFTYLQGPWNGSPVDKKGGLYFLSFPTRLLSSCRCPERGWCWLFNISMPVFWSICCKAV